MPARTTGPGRGETDVTGPGISINHHDPQGEKEVSTTNRINSILQQTQQQLAIFQADTGGQTAEKANKISHRIQACVSLFLEGPETYRFEPYQEGDEQIPEFLGKLCGILTLSQNLHGRSVE